MKIILLGPPGSGKGTIANKLAKDLKLKRISTGDILRAETMKGTPNGRMIAAMIDKGNLVPDELANRIVFPLINGKDNYLLDGFPRTLGQAQFLETQGITQIVFLVVPDKIIVERLSLRRSCPNGHVYHLKNMPPKREGFCDQDGKKLFQRADDAANVVKKRLTVYRKLTAPVIVFYQKKLTKVDGTQDIEQVYKDVRKVLDG